MSSITDNPYEVAASSNTKKPARTVKLWKAIAFCLATNIIVLIITFVASITFGYALGQHDLGAPMPSGW